MAENRSFAMVKPPNKMTTVSTAREDVNGNHVLYVISELINVILTVSTLWILLCMVAYGMRRGKWRSKRKSDMNGGAVYTVAVIGVALTLPRLVIDQVVINAGGMNGTSSCEVLIDVGNGLYSLAIYPIYVFLWFRQRALYAHPAMKKLAGKAARIWSCVTFAGLTIVAIAVSILFIYPDEYEFRSHGTGCALREIDANISTSDRFINEGSYYVLAFLLVLSQISLLGFFVYPMVRSNAVIKDSIRKASESNSTSRKGSLGKNPGSDCRERGFGGRETSLGLQRAASVGLLSASPASTRRKTCVERTIRRSVVFSALCMLSDLAALVLVTVVIPRSIPRYFTNTVYDCGTMVSVICVLGTFENYSSILLIFCRRSRRIVDKTASSVDDTLKGVKKTSDNTVSQKSEIYA